MSWSSSGSQRRSEFSTTKSERKEDKVCWVPENSQTRRHAGRVMMRTHRHVRNALNPSCLFTALLDDVRHENIDSAYWKLSNWRKGDFFPVSNCVSLDDGTVTAVVFLKNYRKKNHLFSLTFSREHTLSDGWAVLTCMLRFVWCWHRLDLTWTAVLCWSHTDDRRLFCSSDSWLWSFGHLRDPNEGDQVGTRDSIGWASLWTSELFLLSSFLLWFLFCWWHPVTESRFSFFIGNGVTHRFILQMTKRAGLFGEVESEEPGPAQLPAGFDRQQSSSSVRCGCFLLRREGKGREGSTRELISCQSWESLGLICLIERGSLVSTAERLSVCQAPGPHRCVSFGFSSVAFCQTLMKWVREQRRLFMKSEFLRLLFDFRLKLIFLLSGEEFKPRRFLLLPVSSCCVSQGNVGGGGGVHLLEYTF